MGRTLGICLCFGLLLTLLCASGNAASSSCSTCNKGKRMKGITHKNFDKTNEGKQVTAWTLTNANGLRAQILDFGGVLYSMEVPDKNGKFENVSCRYAAVAEYQKERPFFGSLVGRYGNRIAKGKFTVDGKDYSLALNNGKNSLHGGLKGFDQVIWNVEPFENDQAVGLTLKYKAKDNEEGYPGNLDVTVVYTLTDKNELIIDYTAVTDKATPINLTNHTFWNLGGFLSGSMRDHLLQLGAVSYLPTDDTLIPTGEILKVDGTPLDFRTAKPIGKDIDNVKEPQFNGGFDHCLILDDKTDADGFRFCAKVIDPKSGRVMTIKTTEPAVQFYSGNFLDGTTGFGDYKYEKHYAFCLETQHYPDSPNQPKFPNTILRPGQTYRHTTVHAFSVEK